MDKADLRRDVSISGRAGSFLILHQFSEAKVRQRWAQSLEAVDGTTLLRTDPNGWIELITDGRQI
jgi:hypothetical protein